jgi:hypothetical protein
LLVLKNKVSIPYLPANSDLCQENFGLYKWIVFLKETRFEPAGNSGGYPSLILAGRPWPAPREKATP